MWLLGRRRGGRDWLWRRGGCRGEEGYEQETSDSGPLQNYGFLLRPENFASQRKPLWVKPEGAGVNDAPPACYTLRSTPSPYNILLKNGITIASLIHFFVPPKRRFPSCIQQSLDLHSPFSIPKLQTPNILSTHQPPPLPSLSSCVPVIAHRTQIVQSTRGTRRTPLFHSLIHLFVSSSLHTTSQP